MILKLIYSQSFKNCSRDRWVWKNKLIQSSKCDFCKVATRNDHRRNLTGNQKGFKISISFVLFIIAFGFAHLLHQQILPFTTESFPYKKLILFHNKDSICQNNNLTTRFGNLLSRFLLENKGTENCKVYLGIFKV